VKHGEHGANSIAVAVLRDAIALAAASRAVPTAGASQAGATKKQIHRKPGKGEQKEKKNQEENFHDDHEWGGRV
jgi:ribosomal protein L12E/L44/L45/RPP1/RPP2